MTDRTPPPATPVPPAIVEELALRSSRELERFRSPVQAIEVHDSASFGRLYRLDGHFMASEKDEFFCHENLVHMAALTHPSPRHALIVGGGDGGSAKELLRHPSLQAVTLCEIDVAVVDVARKHLAAIHRGAFDDPRLKLEIGDGFAFVRASTAAFDLIVLDLTDPGGASLPLYTADFYRACAARLNPQGAMALHVASPFGDPAGVREILSRLRAAFPVMAVAAPSLDPRALSAREVDRRIAQRGLADLRYYNGETHRAALALPNFVRALVAGG